MANKSKRVQTHKKGDWILTLVFSLISLAYVYPLLVVLINSFKKKAFISRLPFSLPDAKTFIGWENYTNGLKKINFFDSLLNSVIITVLSVALILLCTSMCAWFITRVRTRLTRAVYYLCLFSMIVPFQMVMDGMTIGILILNSVCSDVAPSMDAASIRSSGMLCSPAM